MNGQDVGNADMNKWVAQLALTMPDGTALTEMALAALPRDEQAMIAKMKGGNQSQRFWECFERLRLDGFRVRQAAIGAWHATGRANRGRWVSAQSFAVDVLGITRQALHKQIAEGSLLRTRADALREEFWGDKVNDLDVAAYMAAIGVGGTAADRKLAFQRAEVAMNKRLITPDANAQGVDPWAQLAAAGKADS